MNRKVCVAEEIVRAIWFHLDADASVPAFTPKPTLFVEGLPVPGDRDPDGGNWLLATAPEYPFPTDLARAVRAVKAQCDLRVPFLGASAGPMA
ncbi:MAG: hypothetical protein JWP60_3359 [Ramlibacter sp.]|nr:hypothetical protein [Ramlibacter sp.]